MISFNEILFKISTIYNSTHFKSSTLILAYNILALSYRHCVKFNKYLNDANTSSTFTEAIFQVACYMNEGSYLYSCASKNVDKDTFNNYVFQILFRFIEIMCKCEYYNQKIDRNDCNNVDTMKFPSTCLSKIYDLRKLQNGALIGRGSYGDVYVLDLQYVVKRIKLSEDNMGHTCREIACLYSLRDSSYTVKMVDLFVNKKYCYIFLERCTDNLKNRIPILKLEQKTHIVCELFKSIDEIHSKRIIHRDLKPQNILMKTKEQLTTIQICDFGLARVLLNTKNDNGNEDIDSNTNTDVVDGGSDNRSMSDGKYCCSVWYRPIECFLDDTSFSNDDNVDDIRYDFQNMAIDIWSAGCIVYELFTNEPLFMVVSLNDAPDLIYNLLGFPDESLWDSMTVLKNTSVSVLKKYKMAYKDKNWQNSEQYDEIYHDWSPKFAALIGQCLHLDPRQRPSASKILCEFFNNPSTTPVL